MKKTLTIVVPVYNEQKRIARCLTALTAWQVPKEIKLDKVLFVDDGSRDLTIGMIQRKSLDVARELKCKIEIISYTPNRGKGYAVKTGMLASQSEYALFMDADMSTPLDELTKFIPFMRAGRPVIIGTRKNGHSTVKVHQPKYREALGHIFTWMSNTLLGTSVTDFTCGFKMFSREAAAQIFSTMTARGWTFDAESMYLAKKHGFEVTEKAVVWSNQDGSKVRLWKDVPMILGEILAIRIKDMHLDLYHTKLKPALSLIRSYIY